MSNQEALRELLSAVHRIESRLDGHDQRFESIDQRFESIDQRFESMDQRFVSIDRHFEEQKVQVNTLTEFTVTSLNSIGLEMRVLNGRVHNVEQTLETLDHRVLKLELNFEDFRSDTRAYWEQLNDTRSHSAHQQKQLDDHEKRLRRLEAS